jgi:hypothetical protein
MPLIIEPCACEEQMAFNLHRWAGLQADPELQRLAYRIETDRHGRILMSPPPAPAHGNRQGRIAALLMSFLAEGQVVPNARWRRASKRRQDSSQTATTL